MPRGVSRYDEAWLQRRLWTPDAVREKAGAWFQFSDPSGLTFSSGNISGARDWFGNHDLTAATTGGGVIGYVAGADRMAQHRVAAFPVNSAYLKATLTSGKPLFTDTVLTVVALCRSASTVRRGVCTVRSNHSSDFASWTGQFADLCLRGHNAFLTGATNSVSVAYSVNEWFIWAHQFGVNGFLHEAFLNDALTATGSVNRGSNIGTTAGARMNIGTADVATSSNEGLDGQMAEIVILANASNDTRRRCAGYMAHRYQMQHLLPGGHPYRNAPPLI